MGSTGSSSGSNLMNKEYQDMGNLTQSEIMEWLRNNTNIAEWSTDRLTTGELNAIQDYTGSAYAKINDNQYTVPWEEMDEYYKDKIAKIHNGLSKSEVNKPLVVHRACDFQILGDEYKYRDVYGDNAITADEIKEGLRKMNNGVIQNDGFMSFSTDRNGHGLEGHGLIIDLHIPESTGAGAYVNHISYHDEEHEFLVNNNAVLKFDINSVKPVDPKYPQKGYTVDAYWLGQAQAQTISPTNTGKRIKRR